MKIAFVLADKWFRASIDFDGLLKAVAEAGHEPLLVCFENKAGEARFPVVEAVLNQQSDSQFWRSLKLDAAVVWTCLQKVSVQKAIHEAGVTVVSRADSDGLLGIRVNTASAYRNSVQPAKGPRDFVRRAKHFATRYLKYYQHEADEVLGHIAYSDAVCIETAHASDNLRRFLKHHGRSELASRLRVVPHSVPDRYIDSDLNTAPRPVRIFCGGRWNDEQKNPELLAKTISRILSGGNPFEFVIAGRGSQECFATLAESFPGRVTLPGLVPQEDMIPLLNSCRFLLSSSRWESHPIGTLEALCCGCTVVGTPLPGFFDIVDGGRFGEVATRHSADELARATIDENARWDAGERKPAFIAEHWRKIVNNRAVAEGLLSAVVSTGEKRVGASNGTTSVAGLSS